MHLVIETHQPEAMRLDKKKIYVFEKFGHLEFF
jgi:hypothetical protein